MAKKKITNGLPDLKEVNRISRSPFMMWYEVREHLPEADRWVVGYSEIFGSYYICFFSPVIGWQTSKSEKLSSVTHWLDADIPFIFEERDEYNREIAKKYGYKA